MAFDFDVIKDKLLSIVESKIVILVLSLAMIVYGFFNWYKFSNHIDRVAETFSNVKSSPILDTLEIHISKVSPKDLLDIFAEKYSTEVDDTVSTIKLVNKLSTADYLIEITPLDRNSILLSVWSTNAVSSNSDTAIALLKDFRKEIAKKK